MQSAASTPFHAGATSPHALANTSDVLEQINDPAVNLAVWQRAVDDEITRELSATPLPMGADLYSPTSPTSFEEDVARILVQQGLFPERCSSLRADMQRLATRFFAISDRNEWRMRLVVTATDDCRRFHVDRVNLRLLCTYRGPGTEWLRDEQVDRVAQAACKPNESLILGGEPNRLEPGWVAIMKGDPKNEGHGLVHRSPPIEGTGHIRVLFCLDC